MPFHLRTCLLSLCVIALVAACTDHSLNPQPGLYTAILDANFERFLIEQRIDDVQDGRVLTANAQKVTQLNTFSRNIGSLSGIEAFTNLRDLYCGNNNLTQLDVSKNTALEFLLCERNQLTNLNVSQCPRLIRLNCADNKLTTLDVSKNGALELFDAHSNSIQTICVRSLSQVTGFWFKDASATYQVCP